eukprot:311145-Hanusia_phi.AAC.1
MNPQPRSVRPSLSVLACNHGPVTPGWAPGGAARHWLPRDGAVQRLLGMGESRDSRLVTDSRTQLRLSPGPAADSPGPPACDRTIGR